MPRPGTSGSRRELRKRPTPATSESPAPGAVSRSPTPPPRSSRKRIQPRPVNGAGSSAARKASSSSSVSSSSRPAPAPAARGTRTSAVPSTSNRQRLAPSRPAPSSKRPAPSSNSSAPSSSRRDVFSGSPPTRRKQSAASSRCLSTGSASPDTHPTKSPNPEPGAATEERPNRRPGLSGVALLDHVFADMLSDDDSVLQRPRNRQPVIRRPVQTAPRPKTVSRRVQMRNELAEQVRSVRDYSIPYNAGFDGFDDEAVLIAKRRHEREEEERRKFPLGRPQGSSTPRRGPGPQPSATPRSDALSPIRRDRTVRSPRLLFNPDDEPQLEAPTVPEPKETPRKAPAVKQAAANGAATPQTAPRNQRPFSEWRHRIPAELRYIDYEEMLKLTYTQRKMQYYRRQNRKHFYVNLMDDGEEEGEEHIELIRRLYSVDLDDQGNPLPVEELLDRLENNPNTPSTSGPPPRPLPTMDEFFAQQGAEQREQERLERLKRKEAAGSSSSRRSRKRAHSEPSEEEEESEEDEEDEEESEKKPEAEDMVTPRQKKTDFSGFFLNESQETEEESTEEEEEEEKEKPRSSVNRSVKRSPEEVAKLRKEKEELKNRKRALMARRRAAAAERRRDEELDRKTRADIKKMEILEKKKLAEENKLMRQQMIDAEKQKKYEEMKEKDRIKKQAEHDRCRRRESSIRRKKLRDRAKEQRDAQNLALSKSSTPFASRHSKRIRANRDAPMHKPQGRSKSEDRHLGRRRFLEPVVPINLVIPRSRYLEDFDKTIAKMKENLYMTALFETKSTNAVADSLPRNWSMYPDPFAKLREERLEYLRKKYIGNVLDADQSLELSTSDTMEIVCERWKKQSCIHTWSDADAKQKDQFHEIVLVAEKFGFTSLRDLKIPTTCDFFLLPKSAREEGLRTILRKMKMCISMWICQFRKRLPRIVHYFRFLLARIKLDELDTEDSDRGREQYKLARDAIFWLPVHLGDVLDDVHVPRDHLIPLARQMFRIVLNDWPLLFQPCPEAELNALYRLELSALRLEARMEPNSSWLNIWKPLDNKDFYSVVDDRGPPVAGFLPHIDLRMYDRPVLRTAHTFEQVSLPASSSFVFPTSI